MLDNPKRIPLEECKHGGLYRVDTDRAFRLAVFDKAANMFVGIGWRPFMDDFLLAQPHWEASGSVRPVELLEHCPLEDLQAEVANSALLEWLRHRAVQYAPPSPPPPKYVPLDDCRHGGLYRLSSRNLAFGVFVEATQGFVGIREKFGNRYLFTEFHWDTGAPHGTVQPQEFLEDCPLTDLREGWSGEGERQGYFLQNDALFTWLEEQENKYRIQEPTT